MSHDFFLAAENISVSRDFFLAAENISVSRDFLFDKNFQAILPCKIFCAKMPQVETSYH
ncbi:MAG: hypothetical protein IKO05_05665 [Selenomonadaceae bacterium]|nr:hypothetical protein [Selenomonadaceae bacterium]